TTPVRGRPRGRPLPEPAPRAPRCRSLLLEPLERDRPLVSVPYGRPGGRPSGGRAATRRRRTLTPHPHPAPSRAHPRAAATRPAAPPRTAPGAIGPAFAG